MGVRSDVYVAIREKEFLEKIKEYNNTHGEKFILKDFLKENNGAISTIINRKSGHKMVKIAFKNIKTGGDAFRFFASYIVPYEYECVVITGDEIEHDNLFEDNREDVFGVEIKVVTDEKEYQETEFKGDNNAG